MTNVRSIRPDEMPAFLAVQIDPARAADQARYIERMTAAGSMRAPWFFVAERGEAVVGRFAFWSLPSFTAPIAIVLFDVGAAATHPQDRNEIAETLLSRAIADATAADAPEFGQVIDEPVQTPQWQTDPDERAGWLETAGMRVVRATSRWSFAGDPPPPPDPGRLTFRPIEDTGEPAFVDAIARVSSATHDERIQADRERLGPEGEAREMLADVRKLDVETGWLELAYDAAGDLVGLSMPAHAPAMATIGYIGVVPEQRGHRYIDDLLARCTTILRRDMPDLEIRADTDLANAPMAAAFERAGYRRFATRREYELPR